MSRRISVAFSNMVDPGWLAGGQYLYNLLFALRSSEIDIEVVLRVFPGTPKENYEMLNGLFDRVLEGPRPLPYWFEKLPGILKRRFPVARYFEERALRQGGIDAQFLFADPGNARQVPSVTWIPDFQHLYYPDLFTKEDMEFRARFYPTVARRSKLVVLSSQNAFDDLMHVAPDTVHKARILSFVAQVPSRIYEVDSKEIANYYHLPDKFFFLPNQFWAHKNHQTVIKAVSIAKKEIEEVTVVCSGGTYDHRNPGYFDSLLSDIATHNLQNNIRILGRIPREHVMSLMRQSLAVLQPSLFEGWSTSVEEVKSLGKQMILSDIHVHREQNPLSGLYFSSSDPSALASLLLKLQTEKQPGPDLQLEQSAKQNLPKRTERFAQTFFNIMTETIRT